MKELLKGLVVDGRKRSYAFLNQYLCKGKKST
jgi:hypothetical protein